MATEESHILAAEENSVKDPVRNSALSVWRPNVKLIPAKIFYFAFLSSISVSVPYSSVFMKQLGLSAFRIGIISGLRPFLGFVSGVCWGILADKFKLWRGMLLASVFFWGLFYALFYIIPNPVRKSQCPDFQLNSSEIYRENISWLYDERSLVKTYIFCILCVCIGELLQSPTGTVGDTLTLKTLGPDGAHKYGQQRAFGAAGMAINSLLAGYLLSLQRWSETLCGVVIFFSNYYILSILVSVFIGICFIGSIFLGIGVPSCKVEKIEEETMPTKSVLKLFLSIHYGSWLAAVFYMGYCNGTIWGFVFWHLDNLGGSQLLMGADSLITNIVEMISFYTATYLIELVGHMQVMHASLFLYAVRFVLYASISNPWWVILVDILQGLTFSTSWISIVDYSTLMVPSSSLATIQGIVHGVLFGFGNGSGHFISGIFIEYYGAVSTFYGMSVSSIVVFVAFIICQAASKP